MIRAGVENFKGWKDLYRSPIKVKESFFFDGESLFLGKSNS
jgi:hypothetical protein